MLSKKERRERNEIRKRLIEDGILPKPAPKRNYNTYLREVEAMREETTVDAFCLCDALLFFYPHKEKTKGFRFSDEEKVAIKIMHFAIEKQRFLERLKAEGKEQYSVEEFYKEVYCKVFPEREYTNKEAGVNYDN